MLLAIFSCLGDLFREFVQALPFTVLANAFKQTKASLLRMYCGTLVRCVPVLRFSEHRCVEMEAQKQYLQHPPLDLWLCNTCQLLYQFFAYLDSTSLNEFYSLGIFKHHAFSPSSPSSHLRLSKTLLHSSSGPKWCCFVFVLSFACK
jgi:hypothetical protein